ncbi:MAG: hypothetical protein G01um101466_99 [Parcubacteria group bacterium Gr01-1014_66]|nr:MAG: hypothetical protein G01um101466_99 [Parcubacteria group bacterium Gr01-1014_66]
MLSTLQRRPWCADLLPYDLRKKINAGEKIGREEIERLISEGMWLPALSVIAKFLDHDPDAQEAFLQECYRLNNSSSLIPEYLTKTTRDLGMQTVSCEELAIVNSLGPMWWIEQYVNAAIRCLFFKAIPFLVGYPTLIGFHAFGRFNTGLFYILIPEWIRNREALYCGYECGRDMHGGVRLLGKTEFLTDESLWEAEGKILIGDAPRAEKDIQYIVETLWVRGHAPDHILLYKNLPFEEVISAIQALLLREQSLRVIRQY